MGSRNPRLNLLRIWNEGSSHIYRKGRRRGRGRYGGFSSPPLPSLVPLDKWGGEIGPRCYPEPVVAAADFQRWSRDGPGSHVALPWLLKIVVILLTVLTAKEEDFFFHDTRG